MLSICRGRPRNGCPGSLKRSAKPRPCAPWPDESGAAMCETRLVPAQCPSGTQIWPVQRPLGVFQAHVCSTTTAACHSHIVQRKYHLQPRSVLGQTPVAHRGVTELLLDHHPRPGLGAPQPSQVAAGHVLRLRMRRLPAPTCRLRLWRSAGAGASCRCAGIGRRGAKS